MRVKFENERQAVVVFTSKFHTRINRLTKLILTSQTIKGSSQPSSPVKINFDMSLYWVYSWFTNSISASGTHVNIPFSSCNKNSSPLIARLIFRPSRSLHSLCDWVLLLPDAPESKNDKLNMEQGKIIYEIEIVVKGYIKDNWG